MKIIVSIRIAAHHLPGGARALRENTQCGPDVAKIETSTLFDIAEEIVWLEPCSLDRTSECPTCHRGGLNAFSNQPFRLLYRRRDLVDIRDFNLTWEWFGPYDYDGDVKKARFSSLNLLVTPKGIDCNGTSRPNRNG